VSRVDDTDTDVHFLQPNKLHTSAKSLRLCCPLIAVYMSCDDVTELSTKPRRHVGGILSVIKR